jgi:hypothetical protein
MWRVVPHRPSDTTLIPCPWYPHPRPSPAGGTTPVAPPEVTALFDQMKIEVSFKEINGQAFDTFVSILRKNVKDITKEIGKMHV